MSQRMRSWVPAAIAGTALLLAAAALWIALGTVGWEQSLSSYGLSVSLIGLAMALIGALVIRDAPGNVIGVLFAASGLWAVLQGLCLALSTVLPAGSTAQLVMVIVQGVWPPSVLVFLLVAQLYPDGRPMSSRWRAPLVVSVAGAIVSTLALVTSQHVVDGYDGLVNPLAVQLPDAVFGVLAAGGALLVVGIGVAALVGQVLRMRREAGAQRARIAWLVSAVLLMMVSFLGPPPALAIVMQLAAIGCMGVGIVRHRLFDIESVLSRSLVYAVAIVLSLLAALVAAALMGSLSGVGIVPALAAALTALILATLFGRMRRRIDWLLFGRRNEPGAALAILGDRLADVPAPDDVLPVVVATLRESLRLPFVAVTLVGEEEPAATSGRRVDHVATYPLQYGGAPVGSLELGIRRGERGLSAADERLVVTFAAQAGAAAHGAQVTRDLRRSRERLVVAREEERRVMRRELHDGIGPTLAGMSLGLQSLVRSAATEDQRRLAGDILAQAQQSLAEVRTLSRDLRPAALDELGLEAAVRHHAQMAGRMSGGRPEVHVLVGDLPQLPAAVEVAAFRIVQEGITNATRHADADTCSVQITSNGSLVVMVDDNGSGAPPAHAGAGLRSMQERAEELGGECTVTFSPGTGTRVRAVLPLPRHPWQEPPEREGSAP